MLMFKKHPPAVQRRAGLEGFARALDLPVEILRSVHDRLSLVMAMHVSCFTLDYGFLDLSLLCEEYEADPALGVVYYTDLDGVTRSAAVMTLADAQYGCVLDVAALDYCFLMPDEDIYAHSEQVFLDAVDTKLRGFAGRFMLTAPGLSNYVRGDEAADYHKAERTNVWGELMASRYEIEAVTGALLDSVAPGLNTFDRRKYITAVLQLVGHVGKRHRWGYAAYKAMTDEELKAWWIEHWVAMGLDRAVLERLYESVKVWLRPVVEKKVEIGRKLRRRRLGLPLD